MNCKNYVVLQVEIQEPWKYSDWNTGMSGATGNSNDNSGTTGAESGATGSGTASSGGTGATGDTGASGLTGPSLMIYEERKREMVQVLDQLHSYWCINGYNRCCKP